MFCIACVFWLLPRLLMQYIPVAFPIVLCKTAWYKEPQRGAALELHKFLSYGNIKGFLKSNSENIIFIMLSNGFSVFISIIITNIFF